MSEQKQSEANGETVPVSPALEFVVGSKRRSQKVENKEGEPSDGRGEKESEKEKSSSQKSISKKVVNRKPSFEPFSTRIRSDLKRKLKRLSHQREDEGHEVFSVQHFVDEALGQWLEKQKDARSVK